MKSRFIEQIKVLRSKHNITQEQLASVVGVEVNTYRHYESSIENAMPHYLVIIKIARHFKVSIDQLLGMSDFANDKMSKIPPADEPALKNIFAYRIKNARKEKGLTQTNCATQAGISLRQYQEYEFNGNLTMPSYDTLIKIHYTFFLSIDYLLGNTDCSAGKDKS